MEFEVVSALKYWFCAVVLPMVCPRKLVVSLSLFVLASCRYNETEARMLLQMAAGAYGDGSDINDCMM